MDCVHSQSRLVKVVASNGNEMFACQCVICGGKATGWIPHKLIKHPEAVADERSKPPTINVLLSAERSRIDRLKRDAYELRRIFYDNYLSSPQWQTIRRIIFARANGTCERCGIQPATQGHHLTYERLGNERPEDLLAVCRQCHKELHNVERMEALCG